MRRLALLKGKGESEGLFRELGIWLRTPHLRVSPSRRGEARITGPASFEIEAVFDTIAQAWSSQ